MRSFFSANTLNEAVVEFNTFMHANIPKSVETWLIWQGDDYEFSTSYALCFRVNGQWQALTLWCRLEEFVVGQIRELDSRDHAELFLKTLKTIDG